ncbi:Kinase-like protein [Venustampulla echinocandica]|uniref:Kinase-like protein n=1 Tax=Venustampulla echinocandica TaxID=2656787 RepID=A0A370TV87_9HELO|nr:Kinase-like protein [Venustampulla echinocandica]RDL39420.1 Kinase-like protein [Venustampulla echinocandica]
MDNDLVVFATLPNLGAGPAFYHKLLIGKRPKELGCEVLSDYYFGQGAAPMSVTGQPLSPCLPNVAVFSYTDVTIESLQPKVIGLGTTCYVTTTDNRTVLKGYQVWFDDNLVFDYGVTCEERLAREATVYEHLGKHSRILTCFGLEEEHHGVHSLRPEMAPLGCIRAYIQKHAENTPPIQHRLQMALDVATGLSYVYLRGEMPCDLSCTNLFVFDKLRIKLGDFVGALLEGFDFEWDQTHESRYHLPSRGREYDDVPLMKRELFALGSAIYEITVWKRSFSELNDDDDDDEVDNNYAKEKFLPLDGNVARDIIWNCWAEAYATAQEVAHDLKSCGSS